MSNKYQLLHVLGTGTFGQAWLVRRRGNNSPAQKKLVIKKVQLRTLSEKELDQALTEAAILARCKHTNVIRYCEAFVERGLLHVVMEFADGGDLRQRLAQQQGVHLPKEVILDWFIQLCFAVKYIHSRHILHRDLKSQNVFLTIDNVIKLGDFGISRVLTDNNDFAQTAIGTPYYLSPEICQKQPYNQKTDIWSLGVILYEMCALHVPFDADNILALATKIIRCDFKPLPGKFGPILQDLVKVLLQAKPELRPAAEQILCIPFLRPCVQSYLDRQKEMIRSNHSHGDSGSPSPRPRLEGTKRVAQTGSPSSHNSRTGSPPEVTVRKFAKASTPPSQIAANNVFWRGFSTPKTDVRLGKGGKPDCLKNDRTPPGSAKMRAVKLRKLDGATPIISNIILRQRAAQSASRPKGPMPVVSIYRELVKRKALSVDSSDMLNCAAEEMMQYENTSSPSES